MGTTYRYIENPELPSGVLAWFRALRAPPVEQQAPYGALLYFRELGPLVHSPDGTVDPRLSPVVSVFLPQVRHGVLWTVGEVHFLATPLRSRLPALHRISNSLKRWLATHECVYSRERADNPFAYYLEGSVPGRDTPVFALPSGLDAIETGRYFVSEDDNEAVLERVCRSLRLRGILCTEA